MNTTKPFWLWQKSLQPEQAQPFISELSEEHQQNISLSVTGKKKTAEAMLCFMDKKEAEVFHQQHGGKILKQTLADCFPPVSKKPSLVIGNKLQVFPYPPSEKEIKKAKLNLFIEPSIAFGTGEHVTTAMCSRQIFLHPAKTKETTMLDVGTGSGILAFIGHSCGYHVTAIDYDEKALNEAVRNAKVNKLQNKILWETTSFEDFPAGTTFDLISANVFAPIFINNWKHFTRLTKTNGILIATGIIDEQDKDFTRSIPRKNWSVKRRLRRGRWTCYVIKKVK